MAGRPLAIGDELQDADALLYAWHGGTMAGPALTDLIFGKESPSGKLPVTFSKGPGRYHSITTGKIQADLQVRRPGHQLRRYRLILPKTRWVTGHFISITVTLPSPFGYGLSYTTFDYSDLKLSSQVMDASGSITVTARVTNSGNMDADEIVQLYIRDRVGSITRPVKELKGFRRLHIKIGETADVEFVINSADLAFFNGAVTLTKPGEFDVWIGPNSDEGLSVILLLNNFTGI